jgi:hypothetical protein
MSDPTKLLVNKSAVEHLRSEARQMHDRIRDGRVPGRLDFLLDEKADGIDHALRSLGLIEEAES